MSTVWMDGRSRNIYNWLYKMRNKQIWDGYILDTYPTVLELPMPTLTTKKDRIAVIVEPRNHEHLEYVVRNVMYFLGEGWHLAIFHGSKNVELVKHIVGKFSGEKAITIDTMHENLTIPLYNRLLTSQWFWNLIPCEHILIFQTDSLMRKKLPDEWLDYDYLGAPWPYSTRPHGLEYGNGGISLRKKSIMSKIVSEHKPPSYDYPEDLFFSDYFRKYPDAKIASLDTAHSFSTESLPRDSVCIHPDLYSLDPRVLSNMLNNIQYPTT